MTEQTGVKPAETDEQGMASHSWKRRGLIDGALEPWFQGGPVV